MLLFQNMRNKATIPPLENKHGRYAIHDLTLTQMFPTTWFTSPLHASWLVWPETGHSYLSLPISPPEDGMMKANRAAPHQAGCSVTRISPYEWLRGGPVTTVHSSTQACPGTYPPEKNQELGHAPGIEVSPDHATQPTIRGLRPLHSVGTPILHIRATHEDYIWGKCLSYNVSLYCLWLQKTRSTKFNYVVFIKKGQPAELYALLTILHKDLISPTGPMKGRRVRVGDVVTTFLLH